MFFYCIRTVDNEWSSSYKYISTDMVDALNQSKNYHDWYCGDGYFTLAKIDEQFRVHEEWRYMQGTAVEYKQHKNPCRWD